MIHSLEKTPLADRPLGGGDPVNRDGGTGTSGSLPADRPGSESTQDEEEDDDTSSLVEDVTSGEEDEDDDKEDGREPANIITDPFTRSDLVK